MIEERQPWYFCYINDNSNEILPGSSEPQDLGSISYKDSTPNDTSQQTQSIDTTASIVTETFQAEERLEK